MFKGIGLCFFFEAWQFGPGGRPDERQKIYKADEPCV